MFVGSCVSFVCVCVCVMFVCFVCVCVCVRSFIHAIDGSGKEIQVYDNGEQVDTIAGDDDYIDNDDDDDDDDDYDNDEVCFLFYRSF
jgi:hypothetical protein